jgi:hypothetical protein
MSESDPRFVIYRDVKDGYRWRLRSAEGTPARKSATPPTAASSPSFRDRTL